MKMNMYISAVLIALAVYLGLGTAARAAAGNSRDKDSGAAATAAAAETHAAAQDDLMRAEGEKRFHANCGRCHVAPSKFSPRMMGTIIRHMRVRATVTDEDMRDILRYMSQ